MRREEKTQLTKMNQMHAHTHNKVRFKMAESMKTTACWDITPCTLVEIDQYFRGDYQLHHHHDDGGSNHL
jgi:hypothetical protein